MACWPLGLIFLGHLRTTFPSGKDTSEHFYHLRRTFGGTKLGTLENTSSSISMFRKKIPRPWYTNWLPVREQAEARVWLSPRTGFTVGLQLCGHWRILCHSGRTIKNSELVTLPEWQNGSQMSLSPWAPGVPTDFQWEEGRHYCGWAHVQASQLG
jgi:hypothetical protein